MKTVTLDHCDPGGAYVVVRGVEDLEVLESDKNNEQRSER